MRRINHFDRLSSAPLNSSLNWRVRCPTSANQRKRQACSTRNSMLPTTNSSVPFGRSLPWPSWTWARARGGRRQSDCLVDLPSAAQPFAGQGCGWAGLCRRKTINRNALQMTEGSQRSRTLDRVFEARVYDGISSSPSVNSPRTLFSWRSGRQCKAKPCCRTGGV